MKLCWPLQNSIFLSDRMVTESQDLTQKEAGSYFSQEKETGADSGTLIKEKFQPQGPLLA